jgi:hypothetical protein
MKRYKTEGESCRNANHPLLQFAEVGSIGFGSGADPAVEEKVKLSV